MEEKAKYRCYNEVYVDNFGKVTLQKRFLGETYAVSEEKAVSNMKYRLIKQYRNLEGIGRITARQVG